MLGQVARGGLLDEQGSQAIEILLVVAPVARKKFCVYIIAEYGWRVWREQIGLIVASDSFPYPA
jgi:hypothetical protein